MPIDLGGEFLRGMQTAQQASAERERLTVERARIQQETEARSQALNHETQIENARLQTQQAYHDAQISLAQQRLQQQAQVSAAHAKDAALKMADQHGFAADLAAGVPIEKALFRHPNANPASAIAAHKDTLDLGSQRLDLAKENLAAREQEIEDRKNKRGNIGHMSVPVNPSDPFGASMSVPLDSPVINQVLGTNAPPGTGTNFQEGGSAPPLPAPKVNEVIRKTKDGRKAVFNGDTKEFLRYADGN